MRNCPLLPAPDAVGNVTPQLALQRQVVARVAACSKFVATGFACSDQGFYPSVALFHLFLEQTPVQVGSLFAPLCIHRKFSPKRRDSCYTAVKPLIRRGKRRSNPLATRPLARAGNP